MLHVRLHRPPYSLAMLLTTPVTDEGEAHVGIADAGDQHLMITNLDAHPLAFGEHAAGRPGFPVASALARDVPAGFGRQPPQSCQRRLPVAADGYRRVTQPAHLQPQD